MGDGMSKVLVVYGTGSGCTTGVAEQIGRTLAERGVMVDVRPAGDKPAAGGYDGYVIGSGVRAGNWHASVRQWVNAHADQLRAKPVAMFTVGLMIREEGKRDEVPPGREWAGAGRHRPVRRVVRAKGVLASRAADHEGDESTAGRLQGYDGDQRLGFVGRTEARNLGRCRGRVGSSSPAANDGTGAVATLDPSAPFTGFVPGRLRDPRCPADR
jgi:hypothetical protein